MTMGTFPGQISSSFFIDGEATTTACRFRASLLFFTPGFHQHQAEFTVFYIDLFSISSRLTLLLAPMARSCQILTLSW